MPMGRAGKYDALERYLAAHGGDQLTLTFAEIVVIIGEPLPAMARTPQFWRNGRVGERTAHGRAWFTAGYRAHWLRPIGTDLCITFSRLPADTTV